MLGALIPVSDALAHDGRHRFDRGWLSQRRHRCRRPGRSRLLLVAAMAVTPFLNNAATVLVMAPIAASFAAKLGYNPDPFLMAVAIGAACDFLTPIGHQCNTLVMGPGGYRFGDYWRLGLPLSLIVLARRRAAHRLLLADLISGLSATSGGQRSSTGLPTVVGAAGRKHVTALADADHRRQRRASRTDRSPSSARPRSRPIGRLSAA